MALASVSRFGKHSHVSQSERARHRTKRRSTRASSYRDSATALVPLERENANELATAHDPGRIRNPSRFTASAMCLSDDALAIQRASAFFGMSLAMPHARCWRAEGSEASLAVGTRARANTPEGDVGAWGRFVAHAGT